MFAGCIPSKQMRARPTQQEPARSTRERQNETLGQRLSNEAGCARTKRETYRRFALTRGGLHEQQVADVRARDQKQKGNGSEQHEQRQPRVADEKAMQRHEAGAHHAIRLRVLMLQTFDDSLQLCVGLLDRESRLEPRDDAEPVRATERDVGARRRIPSDRHPEVDVLPGKCDARRHDADDGRVATIETNRFSDDR